MSSISRHVAYAVILLLTTTETVPSIEDVGDADGTKLCLLTWNIQRDNSAYGRVATVIRDVDADIVCLQEVTAGFAAFLREALGDLYPHRVFWDQAGSRGGYGILSRLPLGEIAHLRNPGSGRPACRVEILTGVGRIQVLNLHLTYPQVGSGPFFMRAKSYMRTTAVRLWEVQHFCGAVKDNMPAIIVGDLNSLEEEASVRYLNTEMGLVDAYRSLHPERSEADVTWRLAGDPNALMKARIDYVFASPEWVPTSVSILPSAISDHRPVVAEFRRAGAVGTTRHE